MISITNLTKTYRDHPVINNVSLSFPRNGLIAICGPSGCGKTTLLNCLSSLLDFEGEIEIDGMKILFIGIVTEQVLANTKNEGLVGTFVDVEEASREVGRICNTYNSIDIDYTVLLTHIGWEEDHKLAELLDPAWGVDVIIGGHSHTFIEKPDIVNNIFSTISNDSIFVLVSRCDSIIFINLFLFCSPNIPSISKFISCILLA